MSNFRKLYGYLSNCPFFNDPIYGVPAELVKTLVTA